MKYFIFISIFILFSTVAQAELNAIEKIYVEKLKSEDPIVLKKIAKVMHRSGVKKNEILDIAAEIVLQNTHEQLKLILIH